MSEKKRFWLLLILLILSAGLLIYTKTHVGHNFFEQLKAR